MMRFTPAQQAAIDATNPELLVSAAAGSGKTAVLVERIVQMIAQRGCSIDRMLIVTFTRAAAGEMRERLEMRLSDLARTDDRLSRQADLVPMAQISTIHAFCQQAVRQNFQHCGIDPQFGLCDERTRAAMYEDSKNQTLDQLYTLALTDPDAAAFTAKFPEKTLSDIMDALYRFLLSRPDPMDWLDHYADHPWRLNTLDDEPMARAFCQEAALMLDSMLGLWQQAADLTLDPAFPEKYKTAIAADRVTLEDLQSACQSGMRALMQQTGQIKWMRMPTFRPATSDEAALSESFKTLRAQYKALTDELKKLLPADPAAALSDMAVMAPAMRGLQKAIHLFHQIFTDEKKDQGLIDFGDLEHMTLGILRVPGLQRELAGRFDAVFVDEYQDVSELQEAILNGLKRPASEQPPQYSFYVGDVKQSIYRFRQAEPGLFLGKLNRFSPDAGAEKRKINLNRNFRSKTAVLDAVNRIFTHVMDSRVTEIDYDADARLYPGAPSKGDPVTELHILNSYERRPQDMVLMEAEWIAQDILRTIGQPVVDAEGNECGVLHYRDIAVLLPVSKNIAPQVELALTRHGIPVYTENAMDAMTSEEVQQMIQYLTVLDNMMNDIALLSVLRSPIFDMTEQELSAVRLVKPEREASFLTALMEAAHSAGDAALQRRCREIVEALEKERFYLSAMPLSDYMWDFLGRSGLYAHYGAQPGGNLRQANLRMLCARAGEYEKNHADGLHGFVETLLVENASSEISPTVLNSWEDVVRIMTIHKSKGLEFPTVYVMNLGRSLFGRGSTHTVSVHGEVGFGIGYVNKEARTRRSTLMQGAIALREKNAERAERARVLYVALTRPKSRLVMVGSQSEAACDYDALVARTQKPSDVYAVRSASSMLEWVLQCLSPEDEVVELSTDGVRKTGAKDELSTEFTSFPQKSSHWKVVFHKDPSEFRLNSSKNNKGWPLIAMAAQPAESAHVIFAARAAGQDPLLPAFETSAMPLKVGVTALCRAMEEGQTPEDEEETAEIKRLPLTTAQPRLLSSLPARPAFLEPPSEERGLQTGIETHRVLGQINLDLIRPVMDNDKAVYARVCAEIDRLEASGVMTPQQTELVNRSLVARYLQSDLGKRMLQSPRVMREWAFNLRVQEPFPTIVQGVIDLCFLEDGGWVLVDFKTDRVSAAAELWPRYRRQLGFYRRALEACTPYPVKETLLYSLRLSEACADAPTEKNSVL